MYKYQNEKNDIALVPICGFNLFLKINLTVWLTKVPTCEKNSSDVTCDKKKKCMYQDEKKMYSLSTNLQVKPILYIDTT